ncbi:MAG: biotin transporter BioY, partial [Spirochaetales bacterium]|nr:biotin transporter BioY [Spirochaetales bacterium]
VMYIPGVLHFMNSLEKTFSETMALCVIPYIPGDLIKMVLCILISIPVRRTAASFIFEDEA